MHGQPSRSGRNQSDGLWAITSYFNPLGYRRRRENYAHFRRSLGLPLLAVELAYGPDFELADDDAEILIRLRGGDVMWQKERLLNLALAALPPACTSVAWIDCDVIFERRDWVDATLPLLDRHRLVQPFSHVETMRADWAPGMAAPLVREKMRPIARCLAKGLTVETCLSDRPDWLHIGHGVAWVARRSFIAGHGLYDACVVGGGDHALVAAAFGYFESAAQRQCMNPRYRDHYLSWARPFSEAVAGNVGFVRGRVLHLWHGAIEGRAYSQRHRSFARFDFDPENDLEPGQSGAWRWRSAKPEMHRHVLDYFASRQEDS